MTDENEQFMLPATLQIPATGEVVIVTEEGALLAGEDGYAQALQDIIRAGRSTEIDWCPRDPRDFVQHANPQDLELAAATLPREQLRRITMGRPYEA